MPDLLTVHELAEALRCSEWWIYGQVRIEGMPAVRAGKRWLFILDDVLAWLKDRREQETARPRRRRRALVRRTARSGHLPDPPTLARAARTRGDGVA